MFLLGTVLGIALVVKGIDLILKERYPGGIALLLLGAVIVAWEMWFWLSMKR